jgi:hypothetical protein
VPRGRMSRESGRPTEAWDFSCAPKTAASVRSRGKCFRLCGSRSGSRPRGGFCGAQSQKRQRPDGKVGPFQCQRKFGSAAFAHLALAEKEPVHRNLLLQCERDQEVGVRRRAAFVAIHILLKYAEIARKLALGTISADGCDSVRKFSLESLDCGCGHLLLSSFLAGRRSVALVDFWRQVRISCELDLRIEFGEYPRWCLVSTRSRVAHLVQGCESVAV